MEILTSDEKNTIEELRRRVGNDLTNGMRNDETLFYRFLKARNFKINLAEDMLRKHIAWRIANQVDTILKDFEIPEVLRKYYSYNFIGFDKEGSPVTYHAEGKTDADGLLKSIKFSDFKRYVVWTMEMDTIRLKKQAEKLKRPLVQSFYVHNLEFLTIFEGTKKKNIDMLLFVAKMLQDHYPERMKATYIINAPTFFTIILNAVKKIVADAMLQKLHVFGSEGWKEVLVKLIDPSILPAFLGGLKTDPDGEPYCNTFIVHGSIIPERYYMCNMKKPLSQKPNVKRKGVSERSKFEVLVDIHTLDCAIKWEYETKIGDIGFGLFYQENRKTNSKFVQLIPIDRMQSSDGSEAGMFRCYKKGTYILTFDNTHSWLHSRDLFYKITIVELKNEGSSHEI